MTTDRLMFPPPLADERAPDPRAPQALRPARELLDPATFPDFYAMTVEGDCLLPYVPSGAVVAMTKLEWPRGGDFVCVYFRPEHVRPGGFQGAIKRLTLNIPHNVKRFPFEDHPESNVRAALMFEQFNPRHQYVMRCANVLDVHKAVGFIPHPEPGRVINDRDLQPFPAVVQGA